MKNIIIGPGISHLDLAFLLAEHKIQHQLAEMPLHIVCSPEDHSRVLKEYPVLGPDLFRIDPDDPMIQHIHADVFQKIKTTEQMVQDIQLTKVPMLEIHANQARMKKPKAGNINTRCKQMIRQCRK